jgi:2-dehydropantoate 2-reductase
MSALESPTSTTPTSPTRRPPLDYIVHGAGGIGCVVAARLASIGRSVGLIARGAHLKALRANGLRVVGDTKAEVGLPAAGSVGELALGPSTVVLLTMKSNDTAAALDAAGDHYRDLAIFCLQNGVANEDMVVARGLRAYGCRVLLGGRILEPGVVAHTGSGVLTVGCWPEGIDDVCRSFSADVTASGLEAPLSEHVQAAKWGKLLSNVNNAYLALTNTSVQAARKFEKHRFFQADVQEEALRVLYAAGITVDAGRTSTIEEQIAKLRQPGDWDHVRIPTDPDQLGWPSTWQDLNFQRGQVEVEFFNGEVVRLAERLGLKAPLNDVLWHRCEDAAARRLLPGSETTESLRAATEGDRT